MTVSETIRKALIDAKATSRDGTVVHASMNDVVRAITAALSDQAVVPKAISTVPVSEPCGHRDCEFPNCDCETPAPPPSSTAGEGNSSE